MTTHCSHMWVVCGLFYGGIESMRKKYAWMLTVVTIFVLLVLWYCIAEHGGVASIILPSPKSVVMGLIEVTTEGYGTSGYTLFKHIYGSSRRLFIAFGFAVITAIPLGILCGFNKTISAIINPMIEFYRPLPPLAYYTVLVLWMGIGEESKIMLLYLAGFAPLYISCLAGVKKLNKNILNSAYMLGANKVKTMIYVVFPAILPDIFTGLRTSLGVEYTTLVAAEMVAASYGIGWMVLDASRWLRSDIVFGGVIIMGVTGVAFNKVLELIERKIIHWKGKV